MTWTRPSFVLFPALIVSLEKQHWISTITFCKIFTTKGVISHFPIFFFLVVVWLIALVLWRFLFVVFLFGFFVVVGWLGFFSFFLFKVCTLIFKTLVAELVKS